MSTGPMKTKMQTSSVVGLFVGTMTEFVKEGCQRTENAIIGTYLLHNKPSSFIRSVLLLRQIVKTTCSQLLPEV